MSAAGAKTLVEKRVGEEGKQIAVHGGGWGPYGFVMEETESNTDEPSDNRSSRIGLFVGTAIAGIILAAVLGLIGLFVFKRRHRHSASALAYKRDGLEAPEAYMWAYGAMSGRGFDGSRRSWGGPHISPQSESHESHACTLDARSASRGRFSADSRSEHTSHDGPVV